MTDTDTDLTADEALRDPKTEAWLDSHHVTYEFHAQLDLDHINVVESRRNQARLEELDGDVVDRYARDMADGDTFPPILARRPSPRRKLVLLGGNHRDAAARKAGIGHLAGYVVECEPETATVLMYEDNRRHGLPPSRAERIRQGIHLTAIGISQEAAARMVGVTGPEINRRIKLDEADRRANDLAVPPEWSQLSDEARHQLGRIHADAVFAEAAKVAAAARMTGPATKTFVAAVTKERSEGDQLRVVGTELEERRAEMQAKAGGRARRERTDYSQLLDAARTIRGLDPVKVLRSCADADQRKAAARAALDAAKALKSIHDKING